jgi:hypothetical protein
MNFVPGFIRRYRRLHLISHPLHGVSAVTTVVIALIVRPGSHFEELPRREARQPDRPGMFGRTSRADDMLEAMAMRANTSYPLLRGPRSADSPSARRPPRYATSPQSFKEERAVTTETTRVNHKRNTTRPQRNVAVIGRAPNKYEPGVGMALPSQPGFFARSK